MPGFFARWGRRATPDAPAIYLNDAGYVSSAEEARLYCPTCEPETDPIEECVVVSYCWDHTPSVTGQERIEIALDPLGYSEAGGANNRAACDFIHRGKRDQ